MLNSTIFSDFNNLQKQKEEVKTMASCSCKKEKNTIRFKRFDRTLPALFRENVGNAGYDLFAREMVIFNPGDVKKVKLNVATEIPPEAVGLLFQRSSTFKKWGLKLTNSVGVIDSLYCGDNDEWMGEFRNETASPVTVVPGDKICQVVFLSLFNAELDEVDQLGNKDRGGFGTSFDNASELVKK